MKRFVRPKADPQKTAISVAIAASLIIFIKLFVLGEFDKPAVSAEERSSAAPIAASDMLGQAFTDMKPMFLKEIYPDMDISSFTPDPDPAPDIKIEEVLPAVVEEVLMFKPDPVVDTVSEEWRKFAVEAPKHNGKLKKIVIIIDDLGMSSKYTRASVALPAPLTMAYLPYAKDVDKQAAKARKAGHELLIHTPMEPMGDNVDPGPLALLDNMDAAELKAGLADIFDSFEGYVGINNHMGSKLTSNAAAMDVVMAELKARGLIFVDSKTIQSSVAADKAAKAGLHYAERDVFLDHLPTPEFVADALKQLEAIARVRGYAVGIGHPKKVTIEALRAWIPTLEKRGFVLVPVSDIVRSDAKANSRFAVK